MQILAFVYATSGRNSNGLESRMILRLVRFETERECLFCFKYKIFLDILFIIQFLKIPFILLLF